MTAVETINEIRHLAPLEKGRVVRYVKTLDDGRSLNGDELTSLARELLDEPNSQTSQDLKDRISSGFYGNS